MKLKINMILLGFMSLSSIISCDKLQQNLSNSSDTINKLKLPSETVGSFNFVKTKDNKFKLVVFNKQGKPASTQPAIDKRSKYSSQSKFLSGQQENEVRLFFENGSCTVYSCFFGIGCTPSVIDDDAKCAALKP